MNIEDKVWKEMAIRSLNETVANYTKADKREVEYRFLLEAIDFASKDKMPTNERFAVQRLLNDLLEIVKRKGAANYSTPEETSRKLYFVELRALKEQMYQYGYINKVKVERIIQVVSFLSVIGAIYYLNTQEAYSLIKFLSLSLSLYIVMSILLKGIILLFYKRRII